MLNICHEFLICRIPDHAPERGTFAIAIGKEQINSFQGHLPGLWEAKVDQGHGGEVDDCEDNVAFVPDVGDHDRRNLDNQEGEEPLRHHGEGAASQPKLQWEELTGVDPHIGLPSQGEEGLEEVQHDDRSVPKSLRSNAHENSRKHHADSHASRSNHEQLPAPKSLDGPPGNQAAEKIKHLQATRDKHRIVPRHADGILEHVRAQRGHHVAAGHLLEEVGREPDRDSCDSADPIILEHIAPGPGLLCFHGHRILNLF